MPPMNSLKHLLCITNNFALHRNLSLTHLPCRFLSYSLPTNTINPLVGKNEQVEKLKQKLEGVGIVCQNSFTPGLYHILYCPKYLYDSAMVDQPWRGAYRYISSEMDGDVVNKFRGVETFGQLTEKGLGLEPLGSKLISYFHERKISEGTLKRNGVMQLYDRQDVIAFTYRLNGHIVACKYRKLEKMFWQEKCTQNILYGLDDIKDMTEIIMVEGEIDKLSSEEAGFLNCVSVPCGAPHKVSSKELLPPEKDIAYRYLWNCKEYLEKASRITLATDGDAPGQALAEELARRLGKERCRRVCWPRRNQVACFKDANEVLKYMGSIALRDIIEDAKCMD